VVEKRLGSTESMLGRTTKIFQSRFLASLFLSTMTNYYVVTRPLSKTVFIKARYKRKLYCIVLINQSMLLLVL